MARLGLLGGAFNPPHLGHLLCAQEARAALGLDRVLLVVSARPPHKEIEADPGVQARVHMARLCAEADPGLELCLAEVEREGDSYTIDTLEALQGSDELTFIVGADQAKALPEWRRPERVLELARIGVVERAGVSRAEILEALAAALPQAADRIDFFQMPRIDISSTLVRRRVAAGHAVRYLVPESVAGYIEAEGLYR